MQCRQSSPVSFIHVLHSLIRGELFMHWLVLLEETTVPGFTGSFIFGQVTGPMTKTQRDTKNCTKHIINLHRLCKLALLNCKALTLQTKKQAYRHTVCTMHSTRGFYFQGPRWGASLTRLHSVTPENKQTITVCMILNDARFFLRISTDSTYDQYDWCAQRGISVKCCKVPFTNPRRSCRQPSL